MNNEVALLLMSHGDFAREAMKSAEMVFDMLTYENRIARNRVKMDIYKKYTDDPEVLGYLYSLIEIKPEFIEASVDQIMKTYGTMEQYAVDGLGIGKGMIDTLKGKYLI